MANDSDWDSGSTDNFDRPPKFDPLVDRSGLVEPVSAPYEVKLTPREDAPEALAPSISARSWEPDQRPTTITFQPMAETKMEPVLTSSDTQLRYVFRETCQVVGVGCLFFGLLVSELLRSTGLFLLRPILLALRFLSQLLVGVASDMLLTTTMGINRGCQPMIECCSTYSREVIVPVTASIKLVHHEPVQKV